MKSFLSLIVLLFTAQNSMALETVEGLEVQKYLGTWFEMASIPQNFSKDCAKNTTADYQLAENGEVDVVNSCELSDGSVQNAIGRARINPKFNENSKLQVTFAAVAGNWIWNFAGDYWVIALDENYSWSVVGHPDLTYLWILSRTPDMSTSKLLEIKSFVESVGYDSCQVLLTANDQNSQMGGERLCDLAPSVSDQSQLKKEIIELAGLNTSNKGNQEQVRRELEEKVAHLTLGKDPINEMDWFYWAPGSWRQLWSDEADNIGPGSPSLNLERVYQYVSDDGRAVNIAERVLSDGSKLTFALRAQGTVVDDLQTTEIIQGFSRQGGLMTAASVQFLALDILEEEFNEFTPMTLPEFPNGPIGAQSDLKILFLDRDLKIGTAPNVFSGKSEMFVLVRQEFVQ